jgi:PAS domain S-box-containing protein
MSEIKILLVDDRDDNLVSIEAIFTNDGYQFVKARSGREALKVLLHDQDFSLILMDVKMPGLGGFETASMIYERDKLKHIPIIFITAHSYSDEKVYEGYKAGAVDYIYKPIDPQLLKAKVAAFVEIYKKNRELIIQGEYMKALNSTLKKQSQYVRSLIEASIDPLATVNEEGIITDLNEALTKITGVKREEITGSYFFDYFTDQEQATEVYQKVFERGSISDYPLTLRHKSGKLIEMLFNGSVYKDDLGVVQGVVIVAREKFLSRYSRTLIEASLDPLITIRSDGKITDMNEAMVKITGIEREKIIGTDFFDYFTEAEKARLICEEVFEKGSIIDSPLVLRNIKGKLTDVLFNGSIYRDGRGIIEGAVIVARDVTAQKRFEKELIEAKANAEREKKIAEDAVKSKQQFLSNMSHEIRTPLNSIIGFTKVLMKTTLTDKQQEYLKAIKISGNTLIVLINDILDLAKVDAGKMTFEQIPFRLSASVSTMTHLFETTIREKNLGLELQYDSKIPDFLTGDPVRLHQVLMNLLSNAVKFTSEGKITVKVKLLKQEGTRCTIEFCITDTGIGIPDDQLSHIFDNFQQAHFDVMRVYGGTGLGLAIARHLIEAQGGTISVQSKVGAGSSFSFQLVFNKSEVTELLQPAEDEQVEIMKSVRDIKVLVVEDVKLNQLLMKTLLTDFGFEIDVVDNGKRAIETLQEKHYDIILMDLHMPEMNGFAATRYIRNQMFSRVPIIALTADVTTVDLEKCRQAGMNDYIAKPVDEKLLYNKIIKNLQENLLLASGSEHTDVVRTNYEHINLEYLVQLTRGNPEMRAKIIRIYLDETPKLISQMKNSLANMDWEGFRTAAHSIQPSFPTVGINSEFENMLKKMREYASRQENLEEIREYFGKIENVCVNACEELSMELKFLEPNI